jgi:hypothetical protein
MERKGQSALERVYVLNTAVIKALENRQPRLLPHKHTEIDLRKFLSVPVVSPLHFVCQFRIRGNRRYIKGRIFLLAAILPPFAEKLFLLPAVQSARQPGDIHAGQAGGKSAGLCQPVLAIYERLSVGEDKTGKAEYILPAFRKHVFQYAQKPCTGG